MSKENVAENQDVPTEEPKEENPKNMEGGEIVEGKGDGKAEETIQDKIDEKKDEVEKVEESKAEGEKGKGEDAEIEKDKIDGEHNDKEKIEGEHVEGEHVEGEQVTREHAAGEEVEGEEKGVGEEEQVEGEGLETEGKEAFEGEQLDEGKGYELKGEEYGEENLGEEVEEEQKLEEKEEEELEEEPEYEEEPIDPAAPLNLSDSKEALRPDFELRPEQLAQVEKLWELYQDYTPAYTKIDQYITLKELVYMLNCLFLMTYTEEQLMELVTFVCRPPDDPDRITYDQFLRMVKIRWRDLPQEEEIRSALQFLDPGKTGEVEAEELREILGKLGNKLPSKIIENLLKEIDIGGQGKIGIEDVIAIIGLDLMSDDMFTKTEKEEDEDEEQNV